MSTRVLHAPLLLVGVGLAWRALLCWLTPVPAEDGANYLWMTQQIAHGHMDLALGEVFPPLLPLLAAVPVELGLEALCACQLVLCLAGALAVVPIMRIAELVVPSSAAWAGWMVVLSPLAARFCAEVYTEPMFVLLGALAVLAGLRGRWWALGWLAGLAYWLRPEALLIAAGFLCARPRSAWRACLPLGCLVLALALARAAAAHGFDLMPKLAWNWEKSIAGTGGFTAASRQWLANLVRLPWLWLEAFGVLGALALFGMLVAARPRHRRPAAAPLYWMLGFAMLVIAAFVPRRRFLVDWLFAAAPFAVLGMFTLPSRWRAFVLLSLLALDVHLGLRVTDQDRLAERGVGRFVQARLRPGESMASDMSRVLWFAGQRPLPPRHFTADELVRMARAPGVRYLVLGERRPWAVDVLRQVRAEFQQIELPVDLERLASERHLLVLERR